MHSKVESRDEKCCNATCLRSQNLHSGTNDVGFAVHILMQANILSSLNLHYGSNDVGCAVYKLCKPIAPCCSLFPLGGYTFSLNSCLAVQSSFQG